MKWKQATRWIMIWFTYILKKLMISSRIWHYVLLLGLDGTQDQNKYLFFSFSLLQFGIFLNVDEFLALSNEKHVESVDSYFYTTSPYLYFIWMIQQPGNNTIFSQLSLYKEMNSSFSFIDWKPFPISVEQNLSWVQSKRKGMLYFAILFFSLWKAWPQLNVIWFTWVDSKSKISNGVTFFL